MSQPHSRGMGENSNIRGRSSQCATQARHEPTADEHTKILCKTGEKGSDTTRSLADDAWRMFMCSPETEIARPHRPPTTHSIGKIRGREKGADLSNRVHPLCLGQPCPREPITVLTNTKPVDFSAMVRPK